MAITEETEVAELHITLSSPAENQYWVELRFSQPDESTEQEPSRGPVRFDFEALNRYLQRPAEYGSLLKDILFNSENLRKFYANCTASAGGAGHDLRVRLLIDRSARKLQKLRWETLVDPDDQEFLTFNAERPFSRFIYSDWKSVKLSPRNNLRALIVIASPKDLDQGVRLTKRPLYRIDVPGELSRAKMALKGIQVIDELTSPESDGPRVTLEALRASIRQRAYDILYLVCHGALLPLDPDDSASPENHFLLLDKEDGTHDLVGSEKLVNYIHGLPIDQRPRLVILGPCQSGQWGGALSRGEQEAERSYDEGDLSALGPQLVEAGVPAVIAMQDNITAESMRLFIPAFFQGLVERKPVDVAMAMARNEIRDRADWWVPVLYLRLRYGFLTYNAEIDIRGEQIQIGPGSLSEKPEEFWQEIVASILDERCTPVLGPNFLKTLIGSPREIARRLARKYTEPMTAAQVEELPQVAQTLAMKLGRRALYDIYKEELRQQLRNRFPDQLGPWKDESSLADLLAQVGRLERQNPNDPFRMLASLPFKIYLTTNPDNLLEDALAEVRREAQSLYFCWNNRLISPQTIEQYYNLKEPSVNQPLVYHLLGTLENPRSMVVSEDDFFDYLMWINKPSAQIPLPDFVLSDFIENDLLFLGFDRNDWSYRLINRSILTEDRRNQRRFSGTRTLIQVQPEDEEIRLHNARQYLEQYFSREDFDLYFGSSEEVLQALLQRVNAKVNRTN